MKTKPKILIISGPTGSGETTLTNLLIEKYPQFCRFITTTSRAPRDNEQNGVDYYFISQAKFERKIKNNELLEYTHVKNRDQYYGTSREELNRIISLGKIPVLNVDIVGTRFFAKLFQTVSIFVAPESVEILERDCVLAIRIFSRQSFPSVSTMLALN